MRVVNLWKINERCIYRRRFQWIGRVGNGVVDEKASTEFNAINGFKNKNNAKLSIYFTTFKYYFVECRETGDKAIEAI